MQGRIKKRKERNDERMTDNRIGDEGAKSMSEALKTNTTLTSLDLGREEEERKREKREMMNE